MQRFRLVLVVPALLLMLLLAACGDEGGDGSVEADTPPDADADDADNADADEDAAGANSDDDAETLVVGVVPVPHGDILTHAVDHAGLDFDVEIVEFTDYVQPNVALHEGDVDANYFQHLPYLTQQLDDNPEYDFTPLTGVHVEPLALYSDAIDDVSDLPEGAEIAVPNDPSNLGRSLWLLEEAGVLTLGDTGEELPTEQDVDDNPLDVTFQPVEAATIPSVLPDVAAAVINGNYALEADLSPAEDGLAVESSEDNPYANFLAVRAGDESDPRVVALDEALTSEEVRDHITEDYTDGTVVPAD